MKTMTQTPKRSKTRAIRLCTGSPETLGEHFTFCISVNGKEDFYGGVELAAGSGRGFTVHKEGEPIPYDVNLDNRHSTCECPGFAFRGSCRHLQGLYALIRQGRLPPVRPAPERPAPDLRDGEPEDIFIHEPLCGCRSCEEHEELCLEPYDDAA